MKSKNRNKKGQGGAFGMSFSMIFSIILIVFFFIAAFIGINKFLDYQKCTQTANFVKDLNNDISSAKSSDKVNVNLTNNLLPKSIEYVCFANLTKTVKGGEFEQKVAKDLNLWRFSKSNMFFYPPKQACVPNQEIKYIDLEKITASKNPACFKVIKGSIDFSVVRNPGSSLICLGNNC